MELVWISVHSKPLSNVISVFPLFTTLSKTAQVSEPLNAAGGSGLPGPGACPSPGPWFSGSGIHFWAGVFLVSRPLLQSAPAAKEQRGGPPGWSSAQSKHKPMKNAEGRVSTKPHQVFPHVCLVIPTSHYHTGDIFSSTHAHPSFFTHWPFVLFYFHAANKPVLYRNGRKIETNHFNVN